MQHSLKYRQHDPYFKACSHGILMASTGHSLTQTPHPMQSSSLFRKIKQLSIVLPEKDGRSQRHQ